MFLLQLKFEVSSHNLYIYWVQNPADNEQISYHIAMDRAHSLTINWHILFIKAFNNRIKEELNNKRFGITRTNNRLEINRLVFATGCNDKTLRTTLLMRQ